MTVLDHLSLLSVWDACAAVLILLSWAIVGWVIEHPPHDKPSVSTLMSEYRRSWMKAFEARDNRIFDAQIMGTMRQGTSFFASTSVLAIGGILALIGNTDRLRNVAQEFAATTAPEFVWQLKLILVGFFLTLAFLKFVWAHRLFGYCAVIMGAVEEPGAIGGQKLWQQAAEINIRASTNFTRGLRAMYFALGALGWLVGPLALMVSTACVTYLLWSREFSSIPRAVLMRTE